MPRRYNVREVTKNFKDKTWIERMLFWRTFYKTIYLEVPVDTKEYEKATHEEVEIKGKYPFIWVK